MKHLLLSFFSFAFITQLWADCAGNGMDFWPTGKTVRENPIFMIQGYANDQHIILGLNTDYPVYLKSGAEMVNLIVRETCVGQFYLTQAILVPASKLTVGKVYELVIENTPDYMDPLQNWNSKTSKYEPIKWTVESGEDTTLPSWTQKPDESKKTIVHYGCGPAINVHFNFAVYDESPVLVKATVINTHSGTTTSYYLDVTSLTTIAIGHDMCSGAFIYSDSGSEYTISFDLVDGSGNVKTWSYDPIKFNKPTELNSAEN